MHIPIFRVFYSTTFTVLFLLLLALLLIPAADGIYQSYINGAFAHSIVIASVYVLTAIVALFIYATRLYTLRTHLASIPRAHIPIRKGEVPPAVRKLIVEGWRRSARVAWEAYPKDLAERQAFQDSLKSNGGKLAHGDKGAQAGKDEGLLQESNSQPTWGHIEHPGWSGPDVADIPNLQFEPVILELPHLIEAQAVSLAPPDPVASELPADVTEAAEGLAVQPDPAAVAILQRPASMTLRSYLAHLTALGMLPAAQHPDPAIGDAFLGPYERARFSGQPSTEHDFRHLMSTFTTLLESMSAPDPALLAAWIEDEAGLAPDADIDTPRHSARSDGSGRSTPRPASISRASLSRSTSIASSIVHHRRSAASIPENYNEQDHGHDNTMPVLAAGHHRLQPTSPNSGMTPSSHPYESFFSPYSDIRPGYHNSDSSDDLSSHAGRHSQIRSSARFSNRFVSAQQVGSSRTPHLSDPDKAHDADAESLTSSSSGPSRNVRRTSRSSRPVSSLFASARDLSGSASRSAARSESTTAQSRAARSAAPSDSASAAAAAAAAAAAPFSSRRSMQRPTSGPRDRPPRFYTPPPFVHQTDVSLASTALALATSPRDSAGSNIASASSAHGLVDRPPHGLPDDAIEVVPGVALQADEPSTSSQVVIDNTQTREPGQASFAVKNTFSDIEVSRAGGHISDGREPTTTREDRAEKGGEEGWISDQGSVLVRRHNSAGDSSLTASDS